MSDCNKDDWQTGMWFIISGMAAVAASVFSLLVVGPVLRRR